MKKQEKTRPSHHHAEDPLRHSAPRQVRLTEGGFGVALVAALCVAGALIAGPLLLVKASRDRVRLEHLLRESVATEATVVRVEISRGEKRRRTVHYAYSVDGQTSDGRTRLRERDRRPVEAGSRIPIFYVPSGKRESWLPGYEPRGTPAVLAIVVPAGSLTLATLLAWLIRREWRLLEEGRVAKGVVTSHEKVWQKPQGCRAHYEYHLLSGALRRGHVDKDEKKDAPAVGSSLTIVYDREDPRHNSLYPFQFVKWA